MELRNGKSSPVSRPAVNERGIIQCIIVINEQRAKPLMFEDLKKSALHYHRYPRPGKLEIKATKPLANQRDLALAYSPGLP